MNYLFNYLSDILWNEPANRCHLPISFSRFLTRVNCEGHHAAEERVERNSAFQILSDILLVSTAFLGIVVGEIIVPDGLNKKIMRTHMCC